MDWDDCLMYQFVMLTIVGGCICLIGLICNLISLYSFCRGVVSTATSYQLIWLAVVDSVYLFAWFVCHALYAAMKYFHGGEWDLLYWRVIDPITADLHLSCPLHSPYLFNMAHCIHCRVSLPRRS